MENNIPLMNKKCRLKYYQLALSLVFSYSNTNVAGVLFLTLPFTLSVLTSCYLEGTHPVKDKASNK